MLRSLEAFLQPDFKTILLAIDIHISRLAQQT